MFSASGYAALIRGFRLTIQVEGLRPSTVSHYVRDVERFTAFLGDRPIRSVKTHDIIEYISTLQGRWSPKTIREAQLALRKFFRFLVSDGEVRTDATIGMKLSSYRIDPQPTYREAGVKRLLLVCDAKTLAGLRNRAMLLVLFDTGLREIVRLEP